MSFAKLSKYILFSIFAIYIQALFLYKFTIFGSCLYLPLALVIYFAINLSYVKCMTLTFIISILWDILFPQLLGLNTIINILICHFVFKFHANINKEKFVSVFFSVSVINLFFFLGYWLFFTIGYLNPKALIINGLVSIILNSTMHVAVLYLLVISDRLRITIDETTI
ncbi:MAG TPA: hypothetical protein PLV22_06760 [Candidatus Cloacimonadota bacterium]|nr:hypothetical protein [Candidatus Cloacimonadota bacterium]HOQ80794.1 hypothetical protein [Candidatus Cloacimonadota bacterium]